MLIELSSSSCLVFAEWFEKNGKCLATSLHLHCYFVWLYVSSGDVHFDFIALVLLFHFISHVCNRKKKLVRTCLPFCLYNNNRIPCELIHLFLRECFMDLKM